MMLASGQRAGFFIGDGAGVGKGRQVNTIFTLKNICYTEFVSNMHFQLVCFRLERKFCDFVCNHLSFQGI